MLSVSAMMVALPLWAEIGVGTVVGGVATCVATNTSVGSAASDVGVKVSRGVLVGDKTAAGFGEGPPTNDPAKLQGKAQINNKAKRRIILPKQFWLRQVPTRKSKVPVRKSIELWCNYASRCTSPFNPRLIILQAAT
jgi:hypothetical protein